MTAPFFIWNGVNSTDIGVLLDAYPAIPRAKERVESVTIPGRHGALTLLEGNEEIYDPVIISLDCYLTKTASIETVLNWLRGAGDLVIGSQPNRVYQNARAVNQVDYSVFLYHRKQSRFTVVFECPPFKGVYPVPERVRYIGSTAQETTFSITNNGNLIAYPFIDLTINGTRTVTFTWDNNVFTITNTNRRAKIDCDVKEVLDNGDNVITIRTSGDFPYFTPGQHTCTISQYVTNAYITMRERYL